MQRSRCSRLFFFFPYMQHHQVIVGMLVADAGFTEAERRTLQYSSLADQV